MTIQELTDLLHKEFPKCKFRFKRRNKTEYYLNYIVKEGKDIKECYSKKFTKKVFGFLGSHIGELPFEACYLSYDWHGRFVR